MRGLQPDHTIHCKCAKLSNVLHQESGEKFKYEPCAPNHLRIRFHDRCIIDWDLKCIQKGYLRIHQLLYSCGPVYERSSDLKDHTPLFMTSSSWYHCDWKTLAVMFQHRWRCRRPAGVHSHIWWSCLVSLGRGKIPDDARASLGTRYGAHNTGAFGKAQYIWTHSTWNTLLVAPLADERTLNLLTLIFLFLLVVCNILLII